ncbi:MAG: photosystem reaction center subunit [Hyphomicrobiales bacterium]|nr:photosystem reaction center subunit [Hyphomicrobiales bacterium]
MKMHIAAACLLGTALASAPAFAQDASSTTTPSNATSSSQAANAPAGGSGQFLTQMDTAQWRGSKLVGVDVFGSDDSKIGDINEVIMDQNGQAKAIVIGVGGFLGIGEKNVAIAWDKVKWTPGASASMASSASTPTGPAPTSRDIAQTTTNSAPETTNTQTAATGGATLSTAPGTGVSAGAPAAPSTSTATAPAAPASGSMMGSSSSTTSASTTSASSASTSAQDYPDRAVVALSKQDLQNAPEFKYASQTGASGTGAVNTGTTGTTSTR